jgi:hypothetical protein
LPKIRYTCIANFLTQINYKFYAYEINLTT